MRHYRISPSLDTPNSGVAHALSMDDHSKIEHRRAADDPATAAGVESRLWEIGDIVKVFEAHQTKEAA